jgi:hypothetical protein
LTQKKTPTGALAGLACADCRTALHVHGAPGRNQKPSKHAIFFKKWGDFAGEITTPAHNLISICKKEDSILYYATLL